MAEVLQKLGDSTAPRLSVAEIANPRSVAVIGASESLGKFGGRVLHHLLKHGYEGNILPINPQRARLRDLPAYPAVGAAPGPIDVAIIAVPLAQLEPAIRECAEAGVGAVVVITAGLAEAGPEGRVLQDRLVGIARAAGMRIIGPNCLGFINVGQSLALTSSFSMGIERLPRGPVGAVSQSGALMACLMMFGHDHGIGFSSLFSVGNQADLGIEDFLEYLVEDEATRAIALYVESVAAPARFRALVRQARARGKPVVIAKAGRTSVGAEAAFSHTAGLAGAYGPFAAALAADGAVLTDDPEITVLIADALARWGAGRGSVAVISGSGGGAAVAADRFVEAGIPLSPESPIDLSGPRGVRDLAGRDALLRRLLADDSIGALAYFLTPQPEMAGITEVLAELGMSCGKPVLIVMSAGSIAGESREGLRRRGFPFMERTDDALRVLRGLGFGGATATAAPAGGATAAPQPAALPELQALLEEAAIASPRSIVADSADAAAAAQAAIGGPVAVKLLSSVITHKSDAGGVRLGLTGPEAVRLAFDEIAAAVGPKAFEGVVVQEMASGVAELILGVLHDAQLGSFIAVGSGGIFAELFRDSVLIEAPATPEAVRAKLAELRIWPVLQGARGRPVADIEALVQAIERLGSLAARLGPRLRELDINPLIVRQAGGGVVAVDARAILAPAGAGEPR